jgi:hypothetical protein
MPELKSAELIDGVVHTASPVSRAHWHADGLIQALCGYYCLRTPGTEAGPNGTWLMTSSSAPQPDCVISIRPEFGGRATVRGGLSVGVPELVAEICYSSRSYDLGPKLGLYQSAGVNEYAAVLVEERRIEWRMLIDGSYQLLEAVDGVYRSQVLPGLWIDSSAFWNDDSAALLGTLEQGLASREHSEFVQSLAASRKQTL